MKRFCCLTILIGFAAIAVDALAEKKPEPATSTAPATQTKPATRPAAATALHEAMVKDISTFVMEIKHYGESDKPFYNLYLSVPEYKRKFGGADLAAVISPKQARKLLDAMLDAELLGQAAEVKGKDPAPAGSAYLVWLRAGEKRYVIELAWGPGMLGTLDHLRGAIDEAAAGKQMDILIGRLNGYRKAWQGQ